MEYILVKRFTNSRGVVYYKFIAHGSEGYVQLRMMLVQELDPTGDYEILEG